jgi:hypothetical protein
MSRPRQEVFGRDDAVFPYNRHEVRTQRHPPADLPHIQSTQSTRRFRVVSLNPTCFSKSQKFIAAYRFYRLLSDLCPQISKPTPEDFFKAFMKHREEAGERVDKDVVIKLMLKHAMWLAEEAKRYVDVKSWKEFARTEILDVDEDDEMDEAEYERVVPGIPSSPATLSLSPKRKRVRPRTRPQTHHILSVPILTVAERQFPVLPRIRLRRSTLRTRIRTCIQP